MVEAYLANSVDTIRSLLNNKKDDIKANASSTTAMVIEISLDQSLTKTANSKTYYVPTIKVVKRNTRVTTFN